MVDNLMTQFKDQDGSLPIPLVMIGHSKEVRNEKCLGKFPGMVRGRLATKLSSRPIVVL